MRAAAVLVGAAMACGPRGTQTATPPGPTPDSTTAARAVLGADDGGRWVDRALDRLFAAPAVSAAGDRVLDALGEAPELKPSYAAFLGELVGSPAFMAVVVKVAQSEPGQTPDAIAESLAARVEVALEGPELDAALDAALDRVFDLPKIDGAIDRFSSDLVARSNAVEIVMRMIVAWQPDLEAAVGVSMNAPSFDARLDAYLDDPERSAAIERVIAERIAGDRRLVEAVAGLVDSAGFLAITVARLGEILESPGFRARAIEVLAALIAGEDTAALEAELDDLFGRPEIETAIAAWFDDLAALPQTADLAHAFGGMFEDPGTRAELYRALIGVPRGRTARLGALPTKAAARSGEIDRRHFAAGTRIVDTTRRDLDVVLRAGAGGGVAIDRL